MSMACHGTGPDHCCYIAGEVCSYLETDTIAGRRWVCGLLRKYETWDAVYASPEYQGSPPSLWFADNHPGYGCGDWPQHIIGLELANAGCCFTGPGG